MDEFYYLLGFFAAHFLLMMTVLITIFFMKDWIVLWYKKVRLWQLRRLNRRLQHQLDQLNIAQLIASAGGSNVRPYRFIRPLR